MEALEQYQQAKINKALFTESFPIYLANTYGLKYLGALSNEQHQHLIRLIEIAYLAGKEEMKAKK